MESMKRANDDITMQKKGLRQAAREYDVPVTTLKRRVDGVLPADCKPGPSTVQERLVKYVIEMAQRGFGLSPVDIRSLAYVILDEPILSYCREGLVPGIYTQA